MAMKRKQNKSFIPSFKFVSFYKERN